MTACPRCGSTDPDMRLDIVRSPIAAVPCYWSWHDRPTDDRPTDDDDLPTNLERRAIRARSPRAYYKRYRPEDAERDRDAAARIRELERADDTLKDAAARVVAELYAEHDKDDKLPWCRICGTADGSWPCITRMVADELMEAIR